MYPAPVHLRSSDSGTNFYEGSCVMRGSGVTQRKRCRAYRHVWRAKGSVGIPRCFLAIPMPTKKS